MGVSPQIRLQKLLADAGYGSRRACEDLIAEGRVEVDNQVVQAMGTKVDPENQKVHVDGQLVHAEKKKYFAINKPPGVVATNWDPEGRLRVIDLIPANQRVYTVGRLDKSSEGLIVVTNDGGLANRITHPRYQVPKTYLVQVAGVPEREELRKLERGIHLAEGLAKAERATFKRRVKGGAELELVLTEGRNREIRRLFARIGHKVLRLRRTAIGAFKLGSMPVGSHRELTRRETDLLTQTADRKAKQRSTRQTSQSKSRSKDVRSKNARAAKSRTSGGGTKAKGVTSSKGAKKGQKSAKQAKGGPRKASGAGSGKRQSQKASTPRKAANKRSPASRPKRHRK